MSAVTYPLAGRVVLVTGGNGGIGAATARVLLDRGARVVVVDLDPRTPERAAALHPDRALGVAADVTDRSSLDAAVTATLERFGKVDVAIANAGVLTRASTLRAAPAEDAERLLAVNVGGVLNTVRATLEPVIAQRGQIVLLSSVFAYLNGMGAIPYAMSKAAIEQLGRGLRVELADHGVTTTTAYFSLIQTAMIRDGIDRDALAGELMGTVPKPLRIRLTPQKAAAAIVDGLERRSPRVVRPSRWVPMSALRGVLAPALDARTLRDRRVLDVLARLDQR